MGIINEAFTAEDIADTYGEGLSADEKAVLVNQDKSMSAGDKAAVIKVIYEAADKAAEESAEEAIESTIDDEEGSDRDDPDEDYSDEDKIEAADKYIDNAEEMSDSQKIAAVDNLLAETEEDSHEEPISKAEEIVEELEKKDKEKAEQQDKVDKHKKLSDFIDNYPKGMSVEEQIEKTNANVNLTKMDRRAIVNEIKIRAVAPDDNINKTEDETEKIVKEPETEPAKEPGVLFYDHSPGMTGRNRYGPLKR